ncbi:MAG: bifunctional methylenetetrahydrofolate dehydrogenase/methenyltetrahydrofolate cyclohydrolase [Candidatus Daviesbacteria bacterium]|nr:MAG: bifunctional methylenetetrahydrofolate dehydrogenase/methenyltetrahydrofolate cyclohydrolase [Candidatus Daviesbacteria bacterium]
MDKIIDGKKLAKEHEETLKEKIYKLNKKIRIESILIGDDPASLLYSNLKQKKATEVGIEFELRKFTEDVSWEDVVGQIEELNQNESIHGIMVQLPLPTQFLRNHELQELLDKISPEKDVDGLTGKGSVSQATVRGVISILESENVDLKNKTIVVVGAKGMVGSELIKSLQNKYDSPVYHTKVEGIDKDTNNSCEAEKQADVLISAVGQKNLIAKDCIKPGAVVIDIGGDVDFENVKEIAGKITPPKGGVGPMTVVSLMENAVELASRRD